MNAQEYHELEALHATGTGALMRSPAHYKTEKPTTEAMKFGTLFHAAVLEPDRFKDMAAVMPECDGRTKKGKAIKAAFQEANAGKLWLKAEEAETINAMSAAIRAHPAAAEMLAAPGPVEVPIVWNVGGCRCKSRLDKLIPAWEAVLDLKTTEDSSPDGFRSSLFRFGYHRQGAFYLRAARNLGVANHFVIVAVEKSPPYAVGVYRLDEATIQAGEEELEPLYKLYQKCVESGVWPAYSEEIQDIQLLEWVLRKKGYE